MTAQATPHAADIEAIGRLVATVEHSQRNKDPEGAPLYVISKQADGRWLLTACQNTGVLADQDPTRAARPRRSLCSRQ